jgi:hypothetical protein
LHSGVDRFAFAIGSFGQGNVSAQPYLSNLKQVVSFKYCLLTGGNNLIVHPNDRSPILRHGCDPMVAGVLETDGAGGYSGQVVK